MRRFTRAMLVIVAALLPFPLTAVASPKFYAETLYARSKGGRGGDGYLRPQSKNGCLPYRNRPLGQCDRRAP
jgi:hypothetical protein